MIPPTSYNWHRCEHIASFPFLVLWMRRDTWLQDVEASVRETVESGLMTKDLASFAKGDALSRNDYLETFAFLDAIADTLKSKRR